MQAEEIDRTEWLWQLPPRGSKNGKARATPLVEVCDWLAKNGWGDDFLDLDPVRGIAAGQRWKEALQRAAYRCEVALVLVSKEWLASSWCKAEVDAARLIGKKVITALVGIDKSQVPPGLSARDRRRLEAAQQGPLFCSETGAALTSSLVGQHWMRRNKLPIPHFIKSRSQAQRGHQHGEDRPLARHRRRRDWP